MRISSVSGALDAPFRDREDAGQKLAMALERFRGKKPIVLGLARGGVVLASQVAKYLNAPLDVMVCQKVGAPFHPEFAIGAVAPGGIRVADPEGLRQLGISEQRFEQLAQAKMAEVDRRLSAYRGNRPLPDLSAHTAIIIDDGLATGATALAAVRYARKLGAARVVLAVPVCSSLATSLFESEVEDLICLSEPSLFYSVGRWYEDFSQVGDEEVIRLLGSTNPSSTRQEVVIESGTSSVKGDLTLAARDAGIIIFAHGSGSGRLSPRNQQVASALNKAGHGTLLLDLLTEQEELLDSQTRELRFDIPFLIDRLAMATEWLLSRHSVPLGYFGASTGAAAALGAAVRFREVKAVVSRGGRPDLAESLLPLVSAPVLLIVGERDPQVIDFNRQALRQIGSVVKEIQIVRRATHLFEEEGTLEAVAQLAADWFYRYLK
jgi:putative phosphoribosyl transferase